jgi:hypothetical protein
MNLDRFDAEVKKQQNAAGQGQQVLDYKVLELQPRRQL